MFLRPTARKGIAIFLLGNIVANIFLPSISYALTSGPSQPEFSSFSPVSTAGMVDQFTGDFNYSIPVLEVPGPNGSSYPLSLSYHSGGNPEEEASWVGYGWTLNPGAINRGTRGFPDDYNNESVKYWNKAPKNWTATIGVGVGVELFSTDGIGKLNGTGALRYNNYQGFGYNYGVGVSLGKGLISLGYNETDSNHSFSASINPMALLSHPFTKDKKDDTPPAQSPTPVTADKNKTATSGLQRQAMQMLNKAATTSLLGGNHSMLDYGESNRSTQASQYTGASFNVGTGVQGSPTWLPAGVTANVFGTYSYQENIPLTTLSAAGYMYANEADNTSVSDYYTEKASTYNKRDVFLGIPFNNADVFNVSGEGIGGAFRLHHDRVGEFTPNRKKSSVDIANISVEFDVPLSPQGNLGLGFDGGVGTQSVEEGSWSELGSRAFSKKSFSSVNRRETGDAYGEGAYFQFANELTANPEQQLIDDRAVSVSLTTNDFQNYSPQYGSALLQAANQMASGTAVLASHAREKRGSYIGYHTRGQMQSAPSRYCRSADIARLAYTGGDAARIGEMSVVNQQGRRYTYGLPLYSGREKTLQYGAQGAAAGGFSQHGFILYNQNQETKIGEERDAPYAATYLLTEVTNPDYVDRTLNGPSDDDFGGFTKFNYKKPNEYGTAPYHWRLPYTGHVYEKNSLSDPLDDMGSVSEGDKEVGYLYSVHTKTHTAIFTMSQRLDGRDAKNTEAARISPAEKGNQHLYKLDQIDLYSNSDVTFNATTDEWELTSTAVKPIKTVKFQYTYELCPGVPNSWTATPDRTLKTGGKLTLSRVWFEYQGQVNNKVNLYEFLYRYPSNFNIYPAPYQARIQTEYGKYNRGGHEDDQNPEYQPTNVDAWGNYQFNPNDTNNRNRYDSLKTWVNQRPNSPDFDPAAWQLKVIKLPSKAEIHVQYEQDDYAFVQGEAAHALASLYTGKTGGDVSPDVAADASKGYYYLDPKSVGVAESTAPATNPRTKDAVDSLCTSINLLYGPGKRPIFFKFLYSLIGSAVPEPTMCNTDYVSGYVNLQSAAVVFKDGRKLIRVVVGGAGSYTMPYQVCQDFVKTQRRGKLSPSGNCDPQVAGVPSNNASAKQIVQQMASFVGSFVDPVGMCSKLNPRLSYFKIPVPLKKGGGVRVRRLLTYAADPALDNEAVLYGSEYIYRLAGSTRSSGVATNEPAASRGENALVQFIPREGQSTFSKIIAGQDRKQSEGPLGESVLPAPSVGYSRVIERNIHSGKTNPGFTVSEFFTAHDYPVRYEKTDLNANRRTYYKPGFGSLVSSTVNNEYAAQGFSVILNSMHGQPRRTATYAGDYAHINDGQGATLVTEQVQEYFMPDQTPPVRWNAPGQGDELSTHLPGRDVDLTMAQHAVKDFSLDASMEFDNTFGIVFIFPIPFVTARLSATKNEAAIFTHVTSKVVRYPAIVKSVRMYKDGIYHLEENLALDQNTGKPVAVRSQDEFQGTYLKEDIMAAWLYPEKQSKALNEGVVLTGTGSTGLATVTTASAATGGSSVGSYYLNLISSMNSQGACDLLHYLRKGDLVEVDGQNGIGNLFISGGADYARNRIQLYPTASSRALVANASISTLRVVTSGNTNELAQEAGSTTYHQENATIGLRNNTLAVGSPAATARTPQNQDFLQAFNLQLAGNRPAGVGNFTLPGPYAHMDVSGFYNRLPAAFKPTAHDMKVQNMEFVTNTVNGTTKYTLISFEAVIGSQTQKIE